MSSKRKKLWGLALLLIPLLLACAALLFLRLRPKPDPAAVVSAAEEIYLREQSAGLSDELRAASERCFSLKAAPFRQSLGCASGTVTATVLDGRRLAAGLSDEMQLLLNQRAEKAERRAELYTPEGKVLPELSESLYETALHERLSHAEDYCRSEELPVSLRYANGGWELEDSSVFLSLPVLSPQPGFAESVAALEAVPVRYSLPPAGPGPVPDPACYGETEDPQVIRQLLESDTAQSLIRGQKLDFDPERDMLGRTIYYYLDETILALVWQQDEHGAVGTFAEVFIADGSQLRRKLADDSFGSYQYYYPSEFAAQTNAVLACSGDFYNSGRPDYGLYVYEGQLMRSCLTAGQTCLFTEDGDMLFVYENQFASTEEAQRYLDENRVKFSLSFGPVMIDHGVDVTPYDYYFGEVRDTYARCAVGQLGERHYLMMTINCESPDHYVYVTLRQAADSMLAHGCYNAYTLDGGQTGSILIGGRLINPVQFGVERQMSDIFYFATALPEG
ncbi:MAG: phosphodiester glycosidase family protein [Oscillospiraceae bacterium]|nr:phosphodiester glycosidase family protein [Oscillospiraceae bacterium]